MQGTAKNQRIGDKVFIRYVTWDVEIYATLSGSITRADFPYVRLIFAKDRSGGAITSGGGALPLVRLEKPNVSALNIVSDDCLPVEASYPGTSANAPAICKITRQIKVMTPLTFQGIVP